MIPVLKEQSDRNKCRISGEPYITLRRMIPQLRAMVPNYNGMKMIIFNYLQTLWEAGKVRQFKVTVDHSLAGLKTLIHIEYTRKYEAKITTVHVSIDDCDTL